MTQRLEEYGRDFTKAAQIDYKPQLIWADTAIVLLKNVTNWLGSFTGDSECIYS